MDDSGLIHPEEDNTVSANKFNEHIILQKATTRYETNSLPTLGIATSILLTVDPLKELDKASHSLNTLHAASISTSPNVISIEHNVNFFE